MSFNAEAFLTQTTSEPLSTTVKACPEGEFKFMVDDGDKAIQFREFTSDKGTFHTMEVLCSCLEDSVKTSLGREKVLVPIKMFLDMNAAGDGLDTGDGKNVKLGKLRDTVGQNDGSPWSPIMLKGKGPFMGKVVQRSDKDDPTIKYAEISRVSKIA
jgi:hypothetical protein